MKAFSAKIDIVWGNPFVFVPAPILKAIFKDAGKERGPIPIRGTINGKDYTQTLVKFRGDWRLYVNGIMLKAGKCKLGDKVAMQVAFDPSSRILPTHPALAKALKLHPKAKKTFDRLAPYRQKEINRYLGFMKNEASLQRNVAIVLDYLMGKEPKGLHALLRVKH